MLITGNTDRHTIRAQKLSVNTQQHYREKRTGFPLFLLQGIVVGIHNKV